jgi:hypothetical protein
MIRRLVSRGPPPHVSSTSQLHAGHLGNSGVAIYYVSLG